MGELVWSLAGTHCVWCGKPLAGEAEWAREHGEDFHESPDDRRCWCMEFCWDCDVMEAEPELTRLRALVEAQASMIARLRDGWRESDADRMWVTQRRLDRPREPMTAAEQLVVYGEVRTEEADTDAD